MPSTEVQSKPDPATEPPNLRAQRLRQELSTLPVPLASTFSNPEAIAGAFGAAEQFLGPNRKWTSTDPGAALFLKQLPQHRADAAGISTFTQSVAQADGVDKVNEFLKSKGLSTQLEPSPEKGTVAAATVVDVSVTWEKKGVATTVEHRRTGGTLPAAEFKVIDGGYRIGDRPNAIAELRGTNGVRVFMTELTDAERTSGKTARQLTATMVNGLRNPDEISVYPYGTKFTVPMADFHHTQNLSSLRGAQTTTATGQTFTMQEVISEERFRMNESGARAQSAVAVQGVTLGVSTPVEILINDTYLVWVADSKGRVLFNAIIDTADMKRPKSLK